MSDLNQLASDGAVGRVHSLDFIRGFAILGIPLMNVLSMVGPEWSYYAPVWSPASGPADHVVYLLQSFLVESRFISLFSLLFGVGLAIQYDRYRQRSDRPLRLIRRRLLVLLLFGLAHGFLIWAGDILSTYAITGLILAGMTRRRPRTQVTVGVVLIVLGQLPLLSSVVFSVLTGDNIMGTPALPYTAAQLIQLRETWTGLGRLAANADSYLGVLSAIPLALFWQTGGLMLIGMALYRSGFFTRRTRPGMIALLLMLGLLLASPIVWFRYQVGPASSAGYSTLGLMMLAALPMAIAYAALLTGRVLAEDEAGTPRALTRILTNTGRTAFTVYLSQSVILVGWFWLVTPGLWGTLGRPLQWAIVIVLGILQALGADWWQRTRGQGPMEALWRRLAQPRSTA